MPLRWTLAPIAIICLAGCASETQFLAYAGSPDANSPTKASQGPAPAPDKPPADSLMDAGRLYVCSGLLTLGVGDPQAATWKVRDLTKSRGGYVEAFGTNRLVLRVPAKGFEPLMADIEGLGTVLEREVEVVDVTDAHADVDAELKNLLILRDRLHALLARSKTVEETLKIEQELARVQTRIDRINGRKQRLARQIAYARLTVDLVQRTANPETGGPALRAAYWLGRIGLKALMN